MSTSTPVRYFDHLYASDDPYGYRSRWYERRKRAILMACLSRERFRSVWELGCSNGELTAELATRCDALLATDFSERAVALARARTADLPHVSVHQAHHPNDWPPGSFDLVVFSEVGYFMSRRDVERSATKLRESSSECGLVVACHWLPAFAEAPLSGERVHRILQSTLGLPRVLRYEDPDFLLEAWSRQPRSPAEIEGLR